MSRIDQKFANDNGGLAVKTTTTRTRREGTVPKEEAGDNGGSVDKDVVKRGRLFSQLAKIARREREKHFELISTSALATTQVPMPALVLEPIRIAPDILVENRPAWVEFLIWNRAAAPVSDAFVRARVDARHSIDTYDGIFTFDVKNLDRGQTVIGAISFVLPRADLGNILTLEFCEWGEIPSGGEFPPLVILASATIEFDVGARFSIGMENIFIRETASHHDDTVLVAFNGQLAETSWGDNANLGDHNSTSSRAGISPEVLPVGPFEMMPESGGSVAVSCVIANCGHTSQEEDAKKALEALSTIGAVAATTIMSIVFPFGAAVWAGLSEAIDYLHHLILEWVFADCDTVVLLDGLLIGEQELFVDTFDPNDAKSEAFPWTLRSQKKAGTQLSDWLGGGCRDSDYSVSFSLMRHRVPEMFHNVGSDGVRLSPGQQVSFGPIGHDIVQTMFDVEGNGKVDEHGMYRAPLAATDRKFDVVKWTVYKDSKKGIVPSWMDFAIVLLD